MLASLLADRKDADEQLKIAIGRKAAPWGLSVSSVEIRDVATPVALQDAMSRQAQAEREKQARVILQRYASAGVRAPSKWFRLDGGRMRPFGDFPYTARTLDQKQTARRVSSLINRALLPRLT
jgi:hypothetical protein